MVTTNLATCVVALCVTQLKLHCCPNALIAGRIVVGLYGEVVPRTVGILMVFLLFYHAHLSNLIF